MTNLIKYYRLINKLNKRIDDIKEELHSIHWLFNAELYHEIDCIKRALIKLKRIEL